MKKGIGPLAIALIGIVVAIAVEGVYLANFVIRSEFSTRVAGETLIVQSINELEFVKRALPPAATYSYYQASYYTASRGGYDSLDVQSYSCIPYWRVYTETDYPDYRTRLSSSLLSIFSEYLRQFDKVTFPSFTAEIDEDSGRLSVSTSDKMRYSVTNYQISDDPNVGVQVDTGFFRIYELGRENFIDVDRIRISIDNVIGSHYCTDLKETISAALSTEISNLQSDLNSHYSSMGVSFSLSVGSIQYDPDCNSTFAASVLVNVRDTSKQYMVYDYNEMTTKNRYIGLNFYVFSGNYDAEPPTRSCSQPVKKS